MYHFNYVAFAVYSTQTHSRRFMTQALTFYKFTGSKAFSTTVYKSGTVGTGYWYHVVKISYV